MVSLVIRFEVLGEINGGRRDLRDVLRGASSGRKNFIPSCQLETKRDTLVRQYGRKGVRDNASSSFSVSISFRFLFSKGFSCSRLIYVFFRTHEQKWLDEACAFWVLTDMISSLRVRSEAHVEKIGRDCLFLVHLVKVDVQEDVETCLFVANDAGHILPFCIERIEISREHYRDTRVFNSDLFRNFVV